jgi:hypothetical protein
VEQQCQTTTQRQCKNVEDTVCDTNYAPQAAAQAAPQAPLDTYGAPAADPIDSYGAPAADPIDSYGAPQANPCRKVIREQCSDEPAQVPPCECIV